MLLYIRPWAPSVKSNTRAWCMRGRAFRNFILHMLAPGEDFWNKNIHLQSYIDYAETINGNTIALFKQVTE